MRWKNEYLNLRNFRFLSIALNKGTVGTIIKKESCQETFPEVSYFGLSVDRTLASCNLYRSECGGKMNILI